MTIKWLKLDVNIFDNRKIKLIRKYPEGDTLVLLWLNLLCLAMKADNIGRIELTPDMPYSISDLATITEIKETTVEMGISLFEKFEMIEIFEGGLIEIINFRNRQSIDRIEQNRESNRIRQRRYRENQRKENIMIEDKTEKKVEKKVEKFPNWFEVIEYLNQKAGKSYRKVKTNRDIIIARLNDGYTIEQMKEVVDKMTGQWKGSKMEQYLCPATLFRSSNIERYLNLSIQNNDSKSKIMR